MVPYRGQIGLSSTTTLLLLCFPSVQIDKSEYEISVEDRHQLPNKL